MGKKAVAFNLADEIFTREFFCLCSWTGQTNTETDNTKFALMHYPETIRMFWEIVNNSDKSYDKQANKAFLQSLMNRAKYRISQNNDPAKKIKAAAGKTRPRNLIYKKRKIENKNENDNENENDSSHEANETASKETDANTTESTAPESAEIV